MKRTTPAAVVDVPPLAAMNLSAVDWIVIAGYLAVTLALGVYFRRRSSRSTEDYFVSGRKAAWWLAGTSMVATTFAADTPLVVSGLVYRQGIAGNWLWWSFLLSGMMTVFLFARLWHRSGVITDVEFAELRYAGRPAAFLRGFRAVYLGLLMNGVILGWVTKAMTSIISVTLAGTPLLARVSGLLSPLGSVFAGDDGAALAICVLFLIPFTGLYVALGGLWGVLWTDLFQFVLMMGVVIAVAWHAVAAVGGMEPLLARLASVTAAGPAGAAANAGGAAPPTALLPDFSLGLAGEAMWTLPVLTFVVYLGLQWWASWYPGAEPGGGGFIAQRIFSARDERHGLLSVLWFTVAHYAVRPWPWILTGLAAIVLYPGLDKPETAYLRVLNEHLPGALRGVALAGFLAAFMSTVADAAQLGRVVPRVRFLPALPAARRHGAALREGLAPGHCAAGGLRSVGRRSDSARSRAAGRWCWRSAPGRVRCTCSAWYWWRINAWSEIAAMASSLIVSALLNWQGLWLRLLGRPVPFVGGEPVVFAKTALATAVVATIVWVAVTLVTRPEEDGVLLRFYCQVRPDARGWRRVAALVPEVTPTRDLGPNLTAWASGLRDGLHGAVRHRQTAAGRAGAGIALLLGSAACAALLARFLSARFWRAEHRGGRVSPWKRIMTSRERVRIAMRLGEPDRVPVMCQLAIGHYFLQSGLDPVEIWHDTEAFGEALVRLQRRYRFDGILVNLPGRDPAWRRAHRRGRARQRPNGHPLAERVGDSRAGRRHLPWVCREDGSRFRLEFGAIDPARLFYVEPHGLAGPCYPYAPGFDPAPADAFPPCQFDTIKYVPATGRATSRCTRRSSPRSRS